MPKHIKHQTKNTLQSVVIHNKQLGPSYYRLGLQFIGQKAKAFISFIPGQFVAIDISHVALPRQEAIPPSLLDKADRMVLLRRPFSLSNVTVHNETIDIDIIYAVIGPATLRMTTLKPGDQLNVIGPLGNGFTIPKKKTTALYITGGVGAPPIQHLALSAATQGIFEKQVLFAGARTAYDLPFETKKGKNGPVLIDFIDYDIDIHLSTDDGTTGFAGFITECFQQWIHDHPELPSKTTIIYTCGPEPMMAQVAHMAKENGMDCQASLERYMACGFNLCQGCAVECRIPGSKDTIYKMCCQQGPVFDAQEVIFPE